MSDTTNDAPQSDAATQEVESTGSRADEQQTQSSENEVSVGAEDAQDDRDQTDNAGDDDDQDESEDTGEDDSGDDPEESSKVQKLLRKKNSENKNLRERLKVTERKLSQREAADATGLPSDLAGRLQGDTFDELKADAEKLIESFHLNGGLVPGQGVRGGDRYGGFDAQSTDDTADLNQIGARIYER